MSLLPDKSRPAVASSEGARGEVAREETTHLRVPPQQVLPQRVSPQPVLPQPVLPQQVLPRQVLLQEFSEAERELLLGLAHESISSALQLREISLDPPNPHLAEPRGAFTSLHLRGELRGCVGYVLPTAPVYRAVAETARAAAFNDNRFPPVTKDEASQLEIELSILSPPAPIRAEAIEVGRHGLLISRQGRRGLLLPQVPVEHGWDRVTFLEQTCRKAGLPGDAWQKGAELEGFTAEIFRDKIL